MDTIHPLDSSSSHLRDSSPSDPLRGVTALYQAHALGLIRLAVIMLGDRPAAEDVVQDAFAGLYRRWHTLSDPGKALSYVRSSVLNGARSALRRASAASAATSASVLTGASVLASASAAGADSAEAAVLLSEEHREVLAAIRRLPDRQREAVVLRFYLELDEADIARTMGISRGTVKSTTSRAIAALRKTLGGQSLGGQS
jgi:RNA polymerase sigma-70 factor (sigma-E family)